MDRECILRMPNPGLWDPVDAPTIASQNAVQLVAARYVRAAVRNKLSRGPVPGLAQDRGWRTQPNRR